MATPRMMLFNGLLWGDIDHGDEPHICFAPDQQVTGLDDLPQARLGDVPRGRADGSVPGPLFWGSRTITVAITLLDDPQLPVVVDRIRDATTTTEIRPLAWDFGRGEYRADVRCTNRSLPTDYKQHRSGVATATLQFLATDPRMQSSELIDILTGGAGSGPAGGSGEVCQSTTLGASTGGLGFPHGFPHGFGTQTSGNLSVTNNGTTDAPWTATIDGPVTSPRIDHVESGSRLEWAGLTVADGQTLVIDSRMRTSKLNGTADRFPTTREWFDIPPGTSSVKFGGGGGDVSTQLTLCSRSAWL